MIADYFLLRKKIILVEDLYLRGGFYEFRRGFNWAAVGALVAGIVVALMGLLAEPLTREGNPEWLRFTAGVVHQLYHYAWFVGFGVAFLVYLRLMPRPRPE
jgi:NCS1 family nucleobase:cation symporter-1